MGLFDLPAPLFAFLDSGLAVVIPPFARLILWAIVAAILSMGLYWLLSPQRRIATAKADATAARRALDAHDGEFADAWPLMRRMLEASVRQLGLVTLPAVLASLPVLFLLAWLSTAYGYGFPADAGTVGLRAVPDGYDARLEPGMGDNVAHDVVVLDQAGETALRLPLRVPVTTIHERQWWNTLFGNPAGYLPEAAPVQRVELDLPEQRFLSFGPAWLGAWYTIFFAALAIASLVIKIAWRIE